MLKVDALVVELIKSLAVQAAQIGKNLETTEPKVAWHITQN